jgi:ubiquinone/menaquinone biosynthesis C-methylase UbiE
LDDPWHRWITAERDGNDPEIARRHTAGVVGICERVVGAANIGPGSSVADLGAGDGIAGFHVLAQTDPSTSVTFIEPSPGLLARIKSRAHELDVAARCRFINAPIESLSEIADGSFDAVIMRAVLAYVPDKPAAFREIFRLLRPGGWLSMADPVFQDRALAITQMARGIESGLYGDRTREQQLLHRWLATQYPDTIDGILKNPLTNYNERHLVNMAAAAGFRPIRGWAEIEVKAVDPVPWESFFHMAPFAGAGTLSDVFESLFDREEQIVFERFIRERLEERDRTEASVCAYLIAQRPPRPLFMNQGARPLV